MKTVLAVAALTLALLHAGSVASAASFDATYRGESAFLTLARGQTGSFTVFWQNTGSEAWTGQSVVLAACLADKLTCDKQDTTEADFNSGWVSSTRYAYPVQSAVAPGDIGTFTYKVKVPATKAAGTYRFNGALWHIPSGTAIHNVGYYHDLKVPAVGASTLATIEPSNGTAAGGDSVLLTGAGFICSPSPSVAFDDVLATVVSCGPDRLTVKTPVHDAGDASVTVTNQGGQPSNSLLFTFEDRTPPTFDKLDVVGQVMTLHFSEPVCVAGGKLSTKASDGQATVRISFQDAGSAGLGAVAGDAISVGNCTTGTYFSEGTVTIDPTVHQMIPGELVTVSILAASSVKDKAQNAMANAKTVAAAAERDVTPPVLTSAAVVSSTKVLVGFDQTIRCGNGITSGFTVRPSGAASRSSTATDCTGTYVGTTVLVTFPASSFAVGTGGTITYDPALLAEGDRVVDLASNAAVKATLSLTPYQPAKIVSAKLTTDAGVFGRADAGDVFRLTFDRDMENTLINSTSMRVGLTDSDGTNVTLRCNGLAGEGGTANASDGFIAADCVRDPDGTGTLKTFGFTLREDSVNSGDVTAAGTTAGLQWPATVVLLDGFVPRFSDLSTVDLLGSTDRVVEQ